MLSRLLVLLMVIAAAVYPKPKERAWHLGKVVSVENGKEERGLTRTRQLQYVATRTYTVRGQKAIYIAGYDSGFPNEFVIPMKDLGIAAGDEIEFAVDGGRFYIKRSKGKEINLELMRSELIESPPVPEK